MLISIKNLIRVVGIIIMILLISTISILKFQLNKAETQMGNLQDELEVKTDSNKTYINKIGQLTTTTIEYTKSIEGLKYSKNDIEKKLYSKIKASDLKIKQLTGAISVINNTIGGGKYNYVDTVYVSDTTEYIWGSKYFNDGYLNLLVYEDSITYIYQDSLYILSAKRQIDRKFILWKWIGWKKTIDKEMIEVISANPKTKNKIVKLKIK